MDAARLSEQQRIGQRMIVGIQGAHVDEEFCRMVRDYKIGNVILFKRNIFSKEQLKQLCGEIQEVVLAQTGLPAFITIDQEGGTVTRLSEDCSNFPGAMAVAATGDPRNAYRVGLMTGQELRAMGVNFDLAPVLDINSNPHNPVIGTRSYGDTPGQVERYGLEMIAGLLDAGVMCCVKHFPGHGDTVVDSHLGLPQIDKDLAQLEQMELMPFRAAIAAGVPGVMTAHILFPRIEPDRVPGTMSRRIITDLLRRRIGFEGLIVSDCMEMAAIQKFYGTPQGIAAACRAGVDMVFCCHTYELAAQAVRLLWADLESGALDSREHLDSVQRILRAKERYAQPVPLPLSLVGGEGNRKLVEEILRQGVTALGQGPVELGSAPFVTGCPPYHITDASNRATGSFTFARYMAEKLGGRFAVSSRNPDAQEIQEILGQARGASSVVLGTYQAHLQPGQAALARELAKLSLPMVCVVLRDPYDVEELPERAWKICVYEYSPRSCDAAAELLRGNCKATGRLPVTQKKEDAR